MGMQLYPHLQNINGKSALIQGVGKLCCQTQRCGRVQFGTKNDSSEMDNNLYSNLDFDVKLKVKRKPLNLTYVLQ